MKGLYLIIPFAPLWGADRAALRRAIGAPARTGRPSSRSCSFRRLLRRVLDVLNGNIFNGNLYTW
jgi:hypothetical protein